MREIIKNKSKTVIKETFFKESSSLRKNKPKIEGRIG